MRKKALLIGCQVFGLKGVDRDILQMKDVLSQRGFEIDTCTGAEATRAGILDRYDRLIEATAEGDAVAIYYSGHGALLANPAYRPSAEAGQILPQFIQYIVPTDMEASTPDDFRGITDIELSALLARLTDRTRNVSVILDCCHAARMSRTTATPKALFDANFAGIEAHLARLEKRGIDLSRRSLEGNPHAVRLVAASPYESAYEYTNLHGERRGALTASFARALLEARDLPVTWDAIGKRVREMVSDALEGRPLQRPEVEGPAGRVLFELREPDRTGVLGYFLDQGRPSLHGGRILGVSVADEYVIMPLGAEAPDPATQLARVEVTEVLGNLSRVRVLAPDDRAGGKGIPDGSSAFPVVTTLEKHAVRIDQGCAELRAALDHSTQLCVAGPDQQSDILATVRVVDGALEVRDAADDLVALPRPLTPGGVTDTVATLRLLARAKALRLLDSKPDPLEISHELEFGRLRGTERERLPRTGALITAGDRTYVYVRNTSRVPLYVSIFDVGVDGAITLLTRAEPSGVHLHPGQEYFLGWDGAGRLVGLPIWWPEQTPRQAARTESLVVILTEGPEDLRALEAPAFRRARERSGKRPSELQLVLDQVDLGGPKNVGRNAGDRGAVGSRYAVEHIDFQLAPGGFLVEEAPVPLNPGAAPKGVPSAPGVRGTLAVQVCDLIVHKNRALFGADVRIDAMVFTNRSQANGRSPYQAKTWRFSGIKDGDRLSFDDLLIFHGDVEDFVDLAVWVSRDVKTSLDLAKLVETSLNSPQFTEAAQALAAVASGAPEAALALGAAATLTQMAYRLLLAATGTSIGLYRTSFLARDRFGEGRHPDHGTLRAQDFSFAYQVVDVSGAPAR